MMNKKLIGLILFLVCLPFSFFACASNSIFQPIPLNTNPPVLAQPIFLAFDESANRGYLINSNNSVEWSNASLIVLDMTNPTAPTVVKAVAMNNFSGQAVLDTANKTLYVTNRLSDNIADFIDQIFQVNIDESSPDFLTLTPFNAEANPFGITTDGSSLYAACSGFVDRFVIGNLSNRTEVSVAIQTTTGTIPNTLNTREISISPTGQFLFLSNQNDVMLILDKNQIPLPDPTIELTNGGNEAIDYVVSNTVSTRGITSDSNYVYVVEDTPPSLEVLTDRTLPLVSGPPQQILISSLAVADIPLGNTPSEVAVDSVNHRAYVTNTQDNTLSVIDTNLLTEIARITIPNSLPNQFPLGGQPFGVAVGHFGGVPYIYVLNQTTDNITIINGTTLAVVTNFPQ
jgi:YVTN family beta-propeller protein